jgi:hypothetical protein
VAQLLAQATALYNDAQTALRNGDLAKYQADVNQIGVLVAQAQRVSAASATPAPNAAPTTPTTRPGTTSSSTSAPSA